MANLSNTLDYKRLFTDINSETVKQNLDMVVYIEFNDDSRDVFFARKDGKPILGTWHCASSFEKDIEAIIGYSNGEVLKFMHNKLLSYNQSLVKEQLEEMKITYEQISKIAIGSDNLELKVQALQGNLMRLKNVVKTILNDVNVIFLDKECTKFLSAISEYKKLILGMKNISPDIIRETFNDNTKKDNLRDSLSGLYGLSVKDFSKYGFSENMTYEKAFRGFSANGMNYLDKIATKFV